MKNSEGKISYFIRILSVTILLNCLIAVFITIVGNKGTFGVNLIFSQCIGISICSLVSGVYLTFEERSGPVLGGLILTAMVVGTLVGGTAAALITQVGLGGLWHEGEILRVLTLGLVFGAFATYLFVSWKRIADSEARLREEKIKRLESERAAAVAHLNQLQAQIEPHFLFNTLSTVLSLMDEAPPKARRMLLTFTDYLHASLKRIRDRQGTLGQEIEMISAYLDLYRFRMEARLCYVIDLPDELHTAAFPPMLLQPIVENAVTHGLEPKLAGGEIRIRVVREDSRLRITVTDTGVGFGEAGGGGGMGIANVKDRLRSLFADRGRLSLETNAHRGVTATIEVPYDQA